VADGGVANVAVTARRGPARPLLEPRGLVTQPPVVIDKTNLAACDVPVEQRSCPAWDQVPQH
jgi:hypothetical protein